MQLNLSKSSTFLLVLAFLLLTVFTIKIYQIETEKRLLKAELIELSNIKYGMFNVDTWKAKVAEIITKKIEELDITDVDEAEARKKIIVFLNKAIDDFEHTYKAKNRKKSIFGISLKNIGADVFNIFDELKNNVPKIADDILAFMEKKENREQLQSYILAQLNQYTDTTFQKIDYTRYQQILEKYETAETELCQSSIEQEIAFIDEDSKVLQLFIVTLYAILLAYILFIRPQPNINYLLFIVFALQFLGLGLMLPMIDIDARITSMEFQLLGETMVFKDQVLYYQSKSIMEVAQIMLSQGDVKIVLVGLLIIMFSIIFPALKLTATVIWLYNKTIGNHKVVHFMVFRSGKWSMADVMVVAIFMSYIGFSSIVSNQLSELEGLTDSLNILTTNYSELQYGFYAFLGFVLMSISISQSLHKTLKTSV